MKKIIFLFSILFSVSLSHDVVAQILNPVKWSFETKKISDTEYDLLAKAKLEKGWYTYSQFIGDNGPIATLLTFKPNAQYQLVGKADEVSDHKKSGFDKIFEMNITKFAEEVWFVQRVKVTGSTDIKGSVTFQTCDDEKCLPPADEDFSFKINTAPNGNSGGGASIKTPVTIPPQYPSTPTAIPTQSTQNQQVTDVKNDNLKQIVPPNKDDKGSNVPLNTGVKNGIINPVKWAFSVKKISETDIDLIYTATIEKGFHIYAPSMKTADLGPLPTSIKYNKSAIIALIGTLKEESAHKNTHKEPVFNNMTVVDFEQNATFIQRIKAKDFTQPIGGMLEYQACTEGYCLPPKEVIFAFDVMKGTGSEVVETPTINTPVALPTNVEENNIAITDISKYNFDKENENNNCTNEAVKDDSKESNLWLIFLLGFGGGLIALLTPCVFPMIPLTVSFFLKSSKNRRTGVKNALIYGASIIIMYVSMGILISALFGSDALNRLSTNHIVNLVFGVLFIIFAISFFGYYEITLPSSWTNKADEASNKEGLIGIFFMAFTLALVSFSCTGPIIGTLLVQTATTSGISAGSTIGMLGFSMALALPFGLFALFPAWLQSLPKSGSWMDDVKVTLGFVEIALAFKFLSNADLIRGWKLLPYEAFLGIWIACALGLAAYFAGFLSFKYTSKLRKWTAGRATIVGAALLLAGYLGMGFRYNPVSETFRTPSLGSGIFPPAGYSYIFPQKCPLNLNCFHDFNEGLAYAKKVNKPVLIDFTGWNCANCRKMEENVWNKPGVMETIRDKFVLISLFTDDRTELKNPYTSKFDGKLKDTEGEMWTDLEATFFNKNSQPFYVLVSPDLKVLNAPAAFTPEVEKYHAFLKCGLDKFMQMKQLSMKTN